MSITTPDASTTGALPTTGATSSARVVGLMRYPIKGFSAEPLDAIHVTPGDPIPGDRAFAVGHGLLEFDPAAPRHFPKVRFLTLARFEALAVLQTRLELKTHRLEIKRDGVVEVVAELDTPEGREAMVRFLTDYLDGKLSAPLRVLHAGEHTFSDVDARVVHIINRATIRDLEKRTGRSVDVARFRANIILDGIPAWSELDWVDQSLMIGDVALRVTARTDRCPAVNVNPASGARDMTLPRFLIGAFDHMDVGVYAHIEKAGQLAVGQAVTVVGGAGALE